MGSKLGDVRVGQVFEITDVPDETTRIRLLRLGFLDGEVECRRHVTNGPIVIRRNSTAVALGARLADRIPVEIL